MKEMTTKQAMEVIAQKMDAREEFKEMLRLFVEKHGYVPKQYEIEYARTKDEKPWRQDSKCMDKLKKAARKMARNERSKNHGRKNS